MAQSELSYADFAAYFPHAPLALCVKECARLSAMKDVVVEGPVLDVGCGDGLFAKVAFGDVEVWGIDIDAKEGRWAQASRAYSQIILGDVTRAHLPQNFFKMCLANCSLEHVPDIQAALRTIEATLQPGGKAYFFVPNKEWASKFRTVRAVRTTLGDRVGAMIQDGIDEFFKHHHLCDEQGWRDLIAKSPLDLVDIKPVLSTATTQAFETFLLPSMAGWINKKLTTRWTNFPGIRHAYAPLAYALAKSVLASGDEGNLSAEFLLIARKRQ